ncbi:MAG TPA: AraC family transcriptional regulator [Burkholderiaceae bacterium]
MNDIANSPLHAGFAEDERSELALLLDRLTGPELEGTASTAIPGLNIHRIQRATAPRHGIQVPSFAIIAQGEKRLWFGGQEYRYDPLHYLVTSVDLPVLAEVITASPTRPYLGMRLDLDLAMLGELILDENLPTPLSLVDSRGLYVNRLFPSLFDSALRLLRLLETPRDIPILAPMIKRELFYRLLMNGQGTRLRQLALKDSHTHRIARAITALRQHFDEPLRVQDLASGVHMSVSSFHQHFKSITAMSPLQYQKQLRLQEARRLILVGDIDVAQAAHKVGYESASQFSREYGRLFGASPLKDRSRWLESRT